MRRPDTIGENPTRHRGCARSCARSWYGTPGSNVQGQSSLGLQVRGGDGPVPTASRRGGLLAIGELFSYPARPGPSGPPGPDARSWRGRSIRVSSNRVLPFGPLEVDGRSPTPNQLGPP